MRALIRNRSSSDNVPSIPSTTRWSPSLKSYTLPAFTNSVSVSRSQRNKPNHSAVSRAKRDESRPSTTPTRPRATSRVSFAKPVRSVSPAAETPRSSSITSTRSAGQPRFRATSRNPYCSRVDSRFVSTCCGVDWRT